MWLSLNTNINTEREEHKYSLVYFLIQPITTAEITMLVWFYRVQDFTWGVRYNWFYM